MHFSKSNVSMSFMCLLSAIDFEWWRVCVCITSCQLPVKQEKKHNWCTIVHVCMLCVYFVWLSTETIIPYIRTYVLNNRNWNMHFLSNFNVIIEIFVKYYSKTGMACGRYMSNHLNKTTLIKCSDYLFKEKNIITHSHTYARTNDTNKYSHQVAMFEALN